MIRRTPFDPIDEQIEGSLVRQYSHVRVRGRVCSLRVAPPHSSHADLLNIDVVISDLPRWLVGRFKFEDRDGMRLAVRQFGFGRFNQVHLRASVDQINYLLDCLSHGHPVELAGREVAIQKDGRSWYHQSHQSLDWMGVAMDNELRAHPDRIEQAGLIPCHSIFVVSVGGEAAAGRDANGQFTTSAVATQVAGRDLMQKAAQNQRQRSLDSQKNQKKESKK